MYNYNHLHYFYITARLGGVSKASKFLTTSQSSLSTQIKVLESALGKNLFEKSGRNMRLTAEGERVFQYCQRMFSVSEELERFLADSNHTEVVQFKIGVTEQIERPFIANLISDLAKSKIKSQRLKVVSGQKGELLELLREQQIDLALTNSSAFGSEFMEVARFDMRVGLYISKALHDLYFKKMRGPKKLKPWMQERRVGMVLPSEKLKLRHETDTYLEKHRLKPDFVLESDVLSVLVRSVVDGMGIGFLPLPYLSGEIRAGTVVQIFKEAKLWEHKLYMIARTSETFHPVAREMVAAIDRLKDLSR